MLLTLVGPTASGKTKIAARLAYELGSEVISADSRQVYRGMDLGTGKDLMEYHIKGKDIPYHLIDIRPAGDKYNLFDFQHDCHRVLEDMNRRGIVHPILCGGTGMYVESILRGYRLPEAPANDSLRQELDCLTHERLIERLRSYGPLHNITDTESKRRTIRAIEIAEYKRISGKDTSAFSAVPSVNFCLDLSRDERRRRISERMKARFAAGMTSEVERLIHEEGVKPENLIYYGLEYKFVTQHVLGWISREEMERQLETAIHQFAKRQMTWFRGMARRGISLHYIDATLPPEEQTEQILRIFSSNSIA